jgi:hypothetical protein
LKQGKIANSEWTKSGVNYSKLYRNREVQNARMQDIGLRVIQKRIAENKRKKYADMKI